MSLLGAGARQNQPWVPFYTNLQIQTSSQGVPITILYGTNRISPNAIWTGGFFAIPQYSNQNGQHSKLGGGGQGTINGWTYYTSLALGVCEGPIYSYRSCYIGQGHWWDLYGTDLSFWTFGTQTQSPWHFLSQEFPGQALNYKGLAYVGGIALNLGSSPNLPMFSFEVQGLLMPPAVVNGFDADPALIIQDFLTNSQYGVGFPPSSIDTTTLLTQSPGDSSYQTYCQAAYLALSPALVNRDAANSIISRWLKLTNSAAVWSGGKLKFIPYGDEPVTGTLLSGSSVTFNPNVTPIFNLADDDYVHESGKDPVEVERADPYALHNWQRVNIRQRFGGPNYVGQPEYQAAPIDVWDQNAIETYGLRMAPDITADEICDPKTGQIAAQLILQRGLYIRNHYKFKLSFEYCLLEPMDIVTLTDANLGLNQAPVRITEIEEDEQGVLSVTAEEFVLGVGTAASYATQLSSPNITNQSIPPARVNPPIIFEPPASLTGGVDQIWIAASGGIAPVYHLAEDSSTGQHLAQQALTASQDSGTQVIFSIYALAAERSACRLNFNNGSADIGCDFNLATGQAGTPDSGITATIASAGSGWYLCAIEATMAAAAVPTVSVLLESALGTTSYAGVSGNGVMIWGAAIAAAGDESLLPPFTAFTGASAATAGNTTPEGAAGTADPNWGGCNVWISTDGITYTQIGTINGAAPMGTLTAALPAPSGANPDAANTLAVNLAESGGTLSSTSAFNAANGTNLSIVDGELLSFVTATLTGTNAYDLTTLYRGLYGTVAAAHSSGALFAQLNGAVFKYNLPAAYLGVMLYVKLQSFNIFGMGVEDLSECTAYSYIPVGSGAPIGPVTQALLLGQNLDFGLVTDTVAESDGFGLVQDTVLAASVDLGTAP